MVKPPEHVGYPVCPDLAGSAQHRHVRRGFERDPAGMGCLARQHKTASCRLALEPATRAGYEGSATFHYVITQRQHPAAVLATTYRRMGWVGRIINDQYATQAFRFSSRATRRRAAGV